MPNSQHILDLKWTWRQREHGDIIAILTWTLDNDRPALVMLPASARRRDHTDTTPCVVGVDDAYLWDEVTGDGAYCARMCSLFAEAMGRNPLDRHTLVKIRSVVVGNLPDLLLMPPMPRFDEGKPVADLIARDAETGKILHEGTATDV